MIRLVTPLTDTESLAAGDQVEFDGILYTARDAAHKRLVASIQEGKELPFPIEGAILYYVGPCPAKPGEVIGSAGPTTAGRMDTLTVPLLERGLKGMIGKGSRSLEVIEAMKRSKAVYFAAIGGAGALIAERIKEVQVVAYPELGTEAIHMLKVERFPAIVAIDTKGRSIYLEGQKRYNRLGRG